MFRLPRRALMSDANRVDCLHIENAFVSPGITAEVTAA